MCVHVLSWAQVTVKVILTNKERPYLPVHLYLCNNDLGLPYVKPPQNLACTSSRWGGERQVGDCSLRLCHQWWRLRLKNHPGRYARWTGSERTVKTTANAGSQFCSTTSRSAPVFHKERTFQKPAVNGFRSFNGDGDVFIVLFCFFRLFLLSSCCM